MEAAAVLEREAPPARRWTLSWPMRAGLVLLFAAVLFFAQLGQRALWSEEVRWAQIPREMLRSGHFFWPTFNAHAYYDKPLGSYWLVLAASFVTGGVDETSARLPSAACGLLAVLLAMLIARRLFDERTAILSGVILATSFSFVFFARTASADMENLTGILAVLWLYLRNENRPPGLWTLGLCLLMAVTSLTKGLLGFALPILILGVHCSLDGPRTWRIGALVARNRWLFNRFTLLAVPLAGLVFLAPFAISMAGHDASDGLAMVWRENLRRFFAPVNHRGPIYLYAGAIFVLVAPWSLLLPAALWPGPGGRGRRFALVYFWATFAFFTLSASRRSYYLLPILPAAAMLTAHLLSRREPLDGAPRLLLRAGLALLALAWIVSGAALVPVRDYLPTSWDEAPDLPCPAAFATCWIVGLACLVFARRRLAWGFAGMAASTFIYLYLFALPELELYRTQREFADAVKKQTRDDARLVLYRTREIVYYLDPPSPLPECATMAELKDALEGTEPPWLILRRRDGRDLPAGWVIRLEETVQPWESAAQAETKLLLAAPVRAATTNP